MKQKKRNMKNLLTLMRTGVKENEERKAEEKERKEDLEEARLTLPMIGMKKPIGENQAAPLRAKEERKERIKEKESRKERMSPARNHPKEKDIPRTRKPLPPVRVRHKLSQNMNKFGMKRNGIPVNGLGLIGQRMLGTDQIRTDF